MASKSTLNIEREMQRAQSHIKKGETKDAAQVYSNLLKIFPQNRRAQQALAKLVAPTAENALPQADCDRISALLQQGQFETVVQLGNALRPKYPREARIPVLMGIALSGLKNFEAAIAHYRHALEIKPDYAEGYFHLGNALTTIGQTEEAEVRFRQALDLNPAHGKAHHNLAIVLEMRKAWGEARDHYAHVAHLDPSHARAHNNCGRLTRMLGDLDRAAMCFRQAFAADPKYADACRNLGVVLFESGKLDDAIAACRKALEVRPDFADAYNTLGNIFQRRGQIEEATAGRQEAPVLGSLSDGNGPGSALRGKCAFEEAEESYLGALAINPDFVDVHNNLATLYQNMARLDLAVGHFKEAVRIQPDNEIARAQLLYQLAHMCAWDALREQRDIIPDLGVHKSPAAPFTLLVLDDNPRRNRLRSETYVASKYMRQALSTFDRPQSRPGRIKVGYFSADFHNHATMYLMIRLFEVHDRDAFEFYAYSYGPDMQDSMRHRLAGAVDTFHDVRDLSDQGVAELARQDRLDIAVDLKGHTQHARTAIFAFRPAPIQIAYLGYPGTVGAPFIDYLVADEIVVPEKAMEHYSEQLIYLPNSYQVNDDTRAIADTMLTREDCDLPTDGFVFCCFNANYKITSVEFDIWMRLLQRVDGSVLWLLSGNKWSRASLRAEAQKRGVDPGRIIFAETMPLGEHLARCRFADLFLDTFVCNAHTTASDALWVGLPVLTKLGEGFAARVAGSLLNAVDLPELITESHEAYEQRALDLALNREAYASIRKKLARNRETAPLFKTELFARHLETAYQLAYQRYFDGSEPQTIRVPASSTRTDGEDN